MMDSIMKTACVEAKNVKWFSQNVTMNITSMRKKKVKGFKNKLFQQRSIQVFVFIYSWWKSCEWSHLINCDHGRCTLRWPNLNHWRIACLHLHKAIYHTRLHQNKVFKTHPVHGTMCFLVCGYEWRKEQYSSWHRNRLKTEKQRRCERRPSGPHFWSDVTFLIHHKLD